MWSLELGLRSRRSKWVFQLQGSWLEVTPNNLSSGFLTIEVNASGTFLVVFHLDTISQVLLGSSFILFLQPYCWMFSTSCSARVLGTVDLTRMLSVKSSAYLRSRLLTGCTTVISLIIIENKMGPNTVPWGTPLFTFTNSVYFPSTTTRCCLLVKDWHPWPLTYCKLYTARQYRKPYWNQKKILSRSP